MGALVETFVENGPASTKAATKALDWRGGASSISDPPALSVCSCPVAGSPQAAAMNLRVSLVLVVGGFLLSSCSSFHPEEGVNVALVDVRLGEVTIWETTAHFTVRVTNERPEPLTLDGSVHKFYLNDGYVGEGVSSEKIEVPRLSSATQDILVHLRNTAVVTRIRPIIEGRAIEYRLKSTLFAITPKGARDLQLEREGRLSLGDFQPKLPPEPKKP